MTKTKKQPKKFTVEKEYGVKTGSFRFNWDKMPPIGTKFEEVGNPGHYWTVRGEGFCGMIECESTDPKWLGYQCVFPNQLGNIIK